MNENWRNCQALWNLPISSSSATLLGAPLLPPRYACHSWHSPHAPSLGLGICNSFCLNSLFLLSIFHVCDSTKASRPRSSSIFSKKPSSNHRAEGTSPSPELPWPHLLTFASLCWWLSGIRMTCTLSFSGNRPTSPRGEELLLILHWISSSTWHRTQYQIAVHLTYGNEWKNEGLISYRNSGSLIYTQSWQNCVTSWCSDGLLFSTTTHL